MPTCIETTCHRCGACRAEAETQVDLASGGVSFLNMFPIAEGGEGAHQSGAADALPNPVIH